MLKNIKMRAALVLFFFVFMVINGAAAQLVKGKTSRDIALKNDSTGTTVRNFDAQRINDYRAQQEFHYDDAAPMDTSWWDRFWNWFWNLFDGILENNYTGGFMKYLVILLAAALVVFIVIKLIGLDLKIFAGKSKSVDIPYDESLENIHEINFAEEIEKAVSNGNYRLAVRLFYLHSLKLLNDRQLISWQPEKTNHAYINEITDPGKRQEFSTLTRQFEYIWYGEFFIDKEGFNVVRNSFERFNVKAL
jgi:hypothetical protein